MSGGSFNYLFVKDSWDMVETEEDLDHMCKVLSSLGYAEDAAREATELLLMLKQSRIRFDVMMQRLSGVFKAVEWWKSCDSGEDEVKRALEEYRS